MNDEALNSVRKKILESVQANPGTNVTQVARAVSCSHATALVHLRILARQGQIEQVRIGGKIYNYERGSFQGPSAKSLPPQLKWFLADNKRRRIVTYLASHANEELVLNRVAKDLSLYHAYLKRCVEALADHRLVELERRGGRYFLRFTGAGTAGSFPDGTVDNRLRV